MPLFWRVFLLNAALLLAAGALLAFSPATISTPVRVVEESVLASAFGVAYDTYRAQTARLVPGVW